MQQNLDKLYRWPHPKRWSRRFTMSLDALIEIASVRIPRVAEVDATATALGVSVSALCDELSRTVAERFVQGVYPFKVADFVMNNLFGFANSVAGEGLPELSWSVYGGSFGGKATESAR